jgi:hypothetical protein
MDRLAAIIFLMLISVSCAAQPDSVHSQFPFDKAEFAFHSGMIMPHVPSIDYTINDYTSGLDIRLFHTTRGNHGWQHLYHFPRVGLGYYHGSLGNEQIYGKAHSLYGFFEAPLLTWQNTAALHYRMAAGLSYVTKTFDPRRNLYNIAIGSHLNLHYNLSLLSLIRLSERYQLMMGMGLTHLSNGKIDSPNKGLNLISGTVGIRRSLYQPVKEELPHQNDSRLFKNQFSLIWSHGLKDHNRFKPAVYYISSLNISYERQYAEMAKAGVGFDAFFNPSLKNHQSQPPENNLANPALYRLGMHVSHDIVVGNFSLTLQLGRYFYNKIFYITDFYNRVGLRYYSNQHWIYNVSLKSHNANAEFIEFGLGYRW